MSCKDEGPQLKTERWPQLSCFIPIILSGLFSTIVSTKILLCNAAIFFCQDTQDCRARAAHRATSVTARARA